MSPQTLTTKMIGYVVRQSTLLARGKFREAPRAPVRCEAS
jgi:hypothetical protein